MGRAIAMFVGGAVVGFCLIFYYVELFGLPLLFVPTGAVIVGLGSAYFDRVGTIFAVATAIGYIIVLSIWIAYTNLFDIADRDGGKTMEMIFILAPAGGAMIGLIATALLGRRGTYRQV
jgi:hypothetical protein